MGAFRLFSIAAVLLGSFCTQAAEFHPIPPDQLSYRTIYQENYDPDWCMYYIWPPDPDPYQLAFNPDTADVNGGTDRSVNPPNGIPIGNGMLDCDYEYRILEVVFRKPAGWCAAGPYGRGISRDELWDAWEYDLQLLRQELGTVHKTIEGTSLMCNERAIADYTYPLILAAILTGDSLSRTFITEFRDTVNEYFPWKDCVLNPDHYQTFPQYLGPDGDADRDGYTNKQEYYVFGPGHGGPTTFIEAVLNPAIHPDGIPVGIVDDEDADGLGYPQEDINLNGVVDPDETDPFNPDTDGDGLNDGIERLQWHSDPLDAMDRPQVPAAAPGVLLLTGLTLCALAYAAFVGGRAIR